MTTVISVPREDLELALRADASIGATASQLVAGWVAMGRLRALLATPDRRDMAAAAYGLKRDAAPPPKYDDTLLPFLALMRNELHANAHKGDREGWLRMTLEQALGEIRHHADKLIIPVMNHDREAIREHAADVANCAMMLADIAGVLSRE